MPLGGSVKMATCITKIQADQRLKWFINTGVRFPGRRFALRRKKKFKKSVDNGNRQSYSTGNNNYGYSRI